MDPHDHEPDTAHDLARALLDRDGVDIDPLIHATIDAAAERFDALMACGGIDATGDPQVRLVLLNVAASAVTILGAIRENVSDEAANMLALAMPFIIGQAAAAAELADTLDTAVTP